MVIWSTNCFLFAGTAANQVPKLTITDTKFPVSVTFLQEKFELLNIFQEELF